MNEVTQDEMLKSIEPKSDQLNADDLLTGPLTVTIKKVRRGDKEQPIVVEIDGHRPYKPCKSMRRVLIAAFSDNPAAWEGQRMTLYCDPDVTWAGVKVGGIRISHLSIKEKKTFLLTHSRGKKSEYVIQPISTERDDAEDIMEIGADIENAETLEQLKAIGFILKTKPKAVQDGLRGKYVERQKELS